MAGIFKAYDVRGIYPTEIDEARARQIGLAFQHILAADGVRPSGQTVVVSRDMRPHSTPLTGALTEGLLEAGFDVLDVGLATTPMNYFAVGHLAAAGGVQVTASHNPAQYNGFKLSRAQAQPVSGDDGIPLLESSIASGDLPQGARRGERREGTIFDAYGEHLLAFLEPPDRPLKLAADAGNGMGTLYRPLLERTGVELVPLYFELDGSFPNHEANPLELENLADLCDAVRSEGADLGVCFDGDADRAAFVDETGEPVGSDLITALIAGALLERAPGSAIVYDVRSSRAVAEYIAERGGVPVRERVGHSFIKATLRARDGVFGGELAGHYYFRDAFFADNSLLAVIHVLNLLRRSGRAFSELVRPLRRYAKSTEINFEVADKEAMLRLLTERYRDGELDRLDGIRIDYPDWWFNVRPSNTEPLLRLVLEAKDEAMLEKRRAELVELIGEPV
jgi:phosphomannomutase